MGISWPTVAASFVSQVVVAVMTVRLALGRFRQEKWWERKYEAYAEILVSLHRLRSGYFIDIEHDLREVELSEDQKTEIKVDYKLSSDELMRHGDLGDFLISQSAVALLKRYGEDTKAASSALMYKDYLHANLRAVENFLGDVLPVSKADLRPRSIGLLLSPLVRRGRNVLRRLRQLP